MIPEAFRRLLDGIRGRRLARRGDAVPDAEAFWNGITYLAEELIPGPEPEIPRDLFIMLAYVWAARAEKGVVHDPFHILRHVRDRAWLGYADTDRLIANIRQELPRSEGIGRMAVYFGEIAAKRSAYLFLPAVAGIERHQASSPLPSSLELDRVPHEFGISPFASLVRGSFALAPKATRERDAFHLALLLASPGPGASQRDPATLYRIAAAQLRAMYERPDATLTRMRVPAIEDRAAARLIAMAEGVSRSCPWLWLETLIIVENWIAGPQWFDHAFEIELGLPPS